MSEKGKNWWITRGVELGDGSVETLGQTGEQVERDDEESLVGFVVVDRV